MEVKLTQGKVALIDDEDWELVSKYSWYAYKNKHGNTFYAATTNSKNFKIRMHRLIMNTPSGKQVDHINGNGLDNRRVNLRVCTNSQNHMNGQKVHGKSVYRGVCKDRKWWKARICVNRQQINLGLFTDEIEAAKAYDEAASKYFGQFANINFKGD
jgi:hypothetical protein